MSVAPLLETLKHLVVTAGNACLMSDGLMKTVCEHALGNYRTLCIIAGELLDKAAQQEQVQLDEKLFFECFGKTKTVNARKQK